MKVDALILPEGIIARVLTAIVKMIRDDIALATPQEVRNTILFQLLGENEDGQPIHMNAYNYFRQAVKIFSNPANLEVHLGYNAQVTTALAVHIILPGEQAANAPLGEGQEWDAEADQFMYTQWMDAQYQILITSDNASEAMIAYNVLKAMLLMYAPNLDLVGLRIPRVSGGDIILQQDIIPPTVFHKALTLAFKYEVTVPTRLRSQVVKAISYNYNICDPFSGEVIIPGDGKTE